MSLGENIKNARKQKGITQKELSEKIGKGFSTVQKYEIDVIVPPISIINKIAEVLEVSVESLVSDKELGIIKESQEMGLSELRKQRKEKLLTSWEKLNDSGQFLAVEIAETLTKNEDLTK